MTGSDDDDDGFTVTVKAKVSSRDNFDKQSGAVTLRIRLRDGQFASITVSKGEDLLDLCSTFGAEHGLDNSSVNHLHEQLKERYRLISQFREEKESKHQLVNQVDEKKSNEKDINVVERVERVNTTKSSYQSIRSQNNEVNVAKIATISQFEQLNAHPSVATLGTLAPSSSPKKNSPSVTSKSPSNWMMSSEQSEVTTTRYSDQNNRYSDGEKLQLNVRKENSLENIPKNNVPQSNNNPKNDILENNVLKELEDNDEKLQENAFNIAKRNIQEWNVTDSVFTDSVLSSSSNAISHNKINNNNDKKNIEKEKEKDSDKEGDGDDCEYLKFEELEKKLKLQTSSKILSPSNTNILLSNTFNNTPNSILKENQDTIISSFNSTQNSIKKNEKSSSLRSTSPSLIQQKKSSERMHGHGEKFENKKAYLRLQYEKDRIDLIQSTTFR